MTKIDIFSGFLGAGKTTLIKKLIKEAYAGKQVVLIENEFGEIGIDGGFMQDAGINITEMNSGCICCSLVGDFAEALKKVIAEFHPDRILIEPSGVGKLSDIIKAVMNAHTDGAELNGFTTVADANKCRMYMRNFGEFYNNQIQYASCIVLSHTTGMSDEKIADAVALLRTVNPKCTMVTTPWEDLTGMQILSAMEKKGTLEEELELLKAEAAAELAEDLDDDDDDDDEDEHDHHCHCHDHDHDHEDNDDDDEAEHEHHHHHEHEAEHGHHHHHHHHHHDGHDADEVFTSWGTETTKKFTKEEILSCLRALQDEKYGVILRAKGIVQATDGTWIHYDYIPGEPDVRSGSASVTGRLCVIGSDLKEDAIAELFGV